MMRFLGTPAAVDEMIRRHGTNTGCGFELTAGLYGAGGREHVVRQMENGLQEAAQPVTASYLSTLARLSTYLKHPELRPPPREATDELPAGDDLRRREELIESAAAQYPDILAEALPQKTGQARAISLAEQLQSRPLSSSGSFSAASREQVAATFLQLPEERQEHLLDFQWSTLASPAMIPALRRPMERQRTAAGPVTDLALRRLYDLAPEEARPLILREIRRPRPGATLKTLGRLPDAELPTFDEALAATFEALNELEATGDFNGAAVRAGLVHRYASRVIADRILRSASVRLDRMAGETQAATLAYFLRVDEVVGKSLLDRALAPRKGPGCRMRLAPVAALRAARAVEALAIARLDDADPDVVVDAIETLGRHGSPAAFGPLHAAFERWQITWAGRASELRGGIGLERPRTRQAMVESAFQQALGAGQQWLTTSNELRVLGGLCVTESCRTLTAHLARVADDSRIVILRVDEPDSSLVHLAQYSFQSITALQEKLAQYPRGGSFTLDVGALDPAMATSVVSRMRRFALDHGVRIDRQP